ncbi:sugar-binding transcriptional regulator [Mesobacillus maritimus]|uniref:sugar-binding transcriptional regulator n=1 Tax=Mesobacillus maritimus TaxID=1643336 RepID=UPI00203AB47F|nr:sugar-binding transcriptional regulator [Mesobacillus maritimus]MCM3585125.1 sugar-binding transcriptional regulator [Mesobacillus maritimus]MCM3668006.1 sugar-binding transcriptional regulator [Mesobacillus maritimus]
MQSLLDIQKRILPDLVDIMHKRYSILKYIFTMQPVGRRNLAGSLGFTERVLRSEVEFLKEQNLIQMSTQGMSLTKEGKDILESLDNIMHEVSGISSLQKELRAKLGVSQVYIVPGDSDQSPWVKRELGKACATCMKNRLKADNIIAVTGGTTMAAVAEMLPSELGEKNLLFVPARGGIGQDANSQANTVSAIMAARTNSHHRMFYVPDQVSNEIYESFIREPLISEMLNLIKSANIVLHGIGDAITMAKRRNTSPEVMKQITEGKAVGEAFGYYFNEAGEIVYKVQTIGLQLDDLRTAEHVIAVAGGASKAKAIKAYMRQAPPSTILITDEGAAKSLVKG